jgi:hypothetical protein
LSVLRVPTRKKYRQNNREKINQVYRKNRLETDPVYKAKISARNLVRKAISKKGYIKNSRTEEILGCSYEDFRYHI